MPDVLLLRLCCCRRCRRGLVAFVVPVPVHSMAEHLVLLLPIAAIGRDCHGDDKSPNSLRNPKP